MLIFAALEAVAASLVIARSSSKKIVGPCTASVHRDDAPLGVWCFHTVFPSGGFHTFTAEKASRERGFPWNVRRRDPNRLER